MVEVNSLLEVFKGFFSAEFSGAFVGAENSAIFALKSMGDASEEVGVGFFRLGSYGVFQMFKSFFMFSLKKTYDSHSVVCFIRVPVQYLLGNFIVPAPVIEFFVGVAVLEIVCFQEVFKCLFG